MGHSERLAENIKQPISSGGICARYLVLGHSTAVPGFSRRAKTVRLYSQVSLPREWPFFSLHKKKKARFVIVIQFSKTEHALNTDTFVNSKTMREIKRMCICFLLLHNKLPQN